MNPIIFIFALIDKFVPIPNADRALMLHDAEQWYKNIVHYNPETPEEHNEMVNKLKAKAELWYVKLGLCVLFIFAVKWVSDFMNSAKAPDASAGTDV